MRKSYLIINIKINTNAFIKRVTIKYLIVRYNLGCVYISLDKLLVEIAPIIQAI